MLTSSKHTTISKQVHTKNELDYSYLREIGIAYLEKFSGKLWTDFNSHDPGITILELLAYAITDLGARINKPIEDILTHKDLTGTKQFFEAHEILPSHPVTASDYRKLFIDVDGVRNAWVLKHDQTVYINCETNALSYEPFDVPENKRKCFKVKGLYKILIDFEDFPSLSKAGIEEKKDSIFKKIKCLYHSNRNLCEDLASIEEVPTQKVGICAHIELHPDADEEQVKAEILYSINQYFSPKLKFHTLQEMLEAKVPTEDIFDGPLLNHGFIKDEDLEKSNLRSEVRLSDLINLISDNSDVKLVMDISMNTCGEKVQPNSDEWRMCIAPGHKPVRCIDSTFSFFKDILPVNVKEAKVEEHLNELIKQDDTGSHKLLQTTKKLEIKKGSYSHLSEYSSVVNDLPLVYGVGNVGLPKSASSARKAQAKQLKAYLLFFDQILANYMKQLQGVKELLAVNAKVADKPHDKYEECDKSKYCEKEVLSVNTGLESTVFAQHVKDLPGIGELVDNEYSGKTGKEFDDLIYGALTNSTEKSTAILDHLLARFAENFGNYAFLMKQLYGEMAQKEMTKTKMKFIQNYASIGYNRGISFNYCCPKNQSWDTLNVSYFQKRLGLLTGIADVSRRNLSQDDIEIYYEENSGVKSYRWRIKKSNGYILKSATKHYASFEEMHNEILMVKHLGIDEANYEIKEAKNGKFHIVLVNKAEDPKSEAYIIARKFAYYKTRATAKIALKKIITEMVPVKYNEGIYVVENILLLPYLSSINVQNKYFLPVCADDDCESCEELDPYSYRVTIVLPGWTERFANMDFRNFMENLIREELPAHVMARICWVGHPAEEKVEENDMVLLEEAYKAFLEQKSVLCITQPDNKLKKLIEALGKQNTIYPKGTLIDCDDESGELKGKVILGRSQI